MADEVADEVADDVATALLDALNGWLVPALDVADEDDSRGPLLDDDTAAHAHSEKRAPSAWHVWVPTRPPLHAHACTVPPLQTAGLEELPAGSHPATNKAGSSQA